MSTRATIRFKDGEEEYFVYRHHDGLPINVRPDIQEAIDKAKGRWSGGEADRMATFFLGIHFIQSERLSTYRITSGFHGDESYKYYVEYNGSEWECLT